MDASRSMAASLSLPSAGHTGERSKSPPSLSSMARRRHSIKSTNPLMSAGSFPQFAKNAVSSPMTLVSRSATSGSTLSNVSSLVCHQLIIFPSIDSFTKTKRKCTVPFFRLSAHFLLFSLNLSPGAPFRSPYRFTSRDFPVISFGCSIPMSSMSVGAISARQPPSLRPYSAPAFTRINGTGFVVWAVNGSPVS